MLILRKAHFIGFISFLVFANSMLAPLSARERSKLQNANDPPESSEISSMIDRIIANEKQVEQRILGLSPRIETYIQYDRPDREVGDVATKDEYFLGRLETDSSRSNANPEIKELTFIPDGSSFNWVPRPSMLRQHLLARNFGVQALVVDYRNFDRKHYLFEPVRWEYLGDVRCLAIDVHLRGKPSKGAFEGRIWVEDHNYAIVRLNGTRVSPGRNSFYIHFDCWRQNLQPGVWLPVYMYSQEADMGMRLRFKSETRLWGYNLTVHPEQQAWTNILVEAQRPVVDSSEQKSDLSPVESVRRLTMDAERNVLDRLEKAGLVAPRGPVDKVLETVVNNLRVTNHLDNLPPVQCRVLLTSNLESFSLAYTIVVSRGLLDVLPDEPSLAMILAHELAHLTLGQKMDTKFAFNDRLQVSDEHLVKILDLARDREDEDAADAKGMEFLKNSPYKDNLGQAGLFLRAAAAAAPNVPRLFGAHLGNGLTAGGALVRMASLTNSGPQLSTQNLDQIAALPMGSRVQVNAWDGTVAFTTRKAVPLADVSEKLPFRVTPIIPYLREYDETLKNEMSSAGAAGATSPSGPSKQ
ncbi:MAG TPA: M48 family metalloprotease [Terriglobia bacterium]|nr:M48 family metalloprotease [Terriglobia bacterium]